MVLKLKGKNGRYELENIINKNYRKCHIFCVFNDDLYKRYE